MTDHEWKSFGEWGSQKGGWSYSYKCSRCGVFKLDPTAHKLLDDGSWTEIPNPDTFIYEECDLALVRRIMES